jgi:hypothetical protein
MPPGRRLGGTEAELDGVIADGDKPAYSGPSYVVRAAQVLAETSLRVRVLHVQDRHELRDQVARAPGCPLASRRGAGSRR